MLFRSATPHIPIENRPRARLTLPYKYSGISSDSLINNYSSYTYTPDPAHTTAMGSDAPKFNVCLIGSGGVGTIGSVVLENSGRASVTAVLRSKFKVVSEKGWDIESVDHGTLKGWKPSRS